MGLAAKALRYIQHVTSTNFRAWQHTHTHTDAAVKAADLDVRGDAQRRMNLRGHPQQLSVVCLDFVLRTRNTGKEV
eukprot:1161480-Pelagomonas_calceolata.AAC.14